MLSEPRFGRCCFIASESKHEREGRAEAKQQTRQQLVDALRARFYGSTDGFMNAKLLSKIVFIIVLLFLLVLIGLNNKQMVGFTLPPIITKSVQQPAAIMYFAFFAVGVLAGAVLTTGTGLKGGGRGGGGAKSSKS
ncbi:MAG TPA: hypothetical protein PKM43_04495 [Verrucomicrobiota bacterium]|nr:hypothetical protein [Verrucomicrobiota bacterium]HRZ37243.1 hypothetical protein [Candidatus Paceibacterota bacterium]